MLPQTNLQLYRLLVDSNWSDSDLARARAAYDLARQLCGHGYRPSHKPFLCHLVGTAGALVRWGERPAMVLAGMLHSAYLYGDFGDGDRGANPQRRAYLIEEIGAEAEQLVFSYTNNRRKHLDEIADRDLRTLELADLLDELSDAGPAFAVGKPVVELSTSESLSKIAAITQDTIHKAAADDFRRLLATLDATIVPKALTSCDRSSHQIKPGVPELRRSKIARGVARLTNQLPGWRKAS